MTSLFVLDTPENAGVVDVARSTPSATVGRIGPYFQVESAGEICIDRRATGCRHAVWYSCVAGVSQGTITQWDKDALRVKPT